MAYEIPGFSFSLEAAGNLAAEQFKLVAVDANGQVAVAGAGVAVAGVLQNDPGAQGIAATITNVGISKCVLGGTVAAGVVVASDATGRVVAAATGDSPVGVLIDGGAVNEIGTLLQVPVAETN